jgi:N-acetylglucosamine-6-phosphate deacetylase
MIAITGGTLVLPDRVSPLTNLVIDQGRIAAVGGPAPAGAETLDADGLFVLPGLFDLHTHGRLIFAPPDQVRDRLAEDCRQLPRTGVTRFLPTLASAPLSDWFSMLAVIEQAMAGPALGAVPMGAHLEGNFLNPAAAGAHPVSLLVPFDPERPEHAELFRRFGAVIRLVTFAPEVPGNERLLPELTSRGIVASLGHSSASPAEVALYVDRGLKHMAHLFNGMKGLNHRDPGPALPGLLDDRISVEIICDGFHLHPEIVRLIHRLKPPHRRVLITDSAILDLPGVTPGADDEPNRLESGAFAGTRLRLSSAVRNYLRFTGCALPEATAMASLYPAAVVGLDRDFGSLEEGKVADLWLAGNDLKPVAAMVAGERVL